MDTPVINQPNHSVSDMEQKLRLYEQKIVAYDELQAALHKSEERFARVTKNIPGMVYQFVLGPDGSTGFSYISDGCRDLYGVSAAEIQQDASIVTRTVHPEDLPSFQTAMVDSATTLTPFHWEGRLINYQKAERWIQAASRPARADDGTTIWDGVMMDITLRKQAEAIRLQNVAHQETIRVQGALLRELSTPLIPITDSVVAMPLIGTIDSGRAQQIIESLLTGVADQHAAAVIIDITGVPIVDTQVANALLRAAQAVKLLGARAILTGIRPEVAQTLVGLGVDLGSIRTCRSLQAGITEALGRGTAAWGV